MSGILNRIGKEKVNILTQAEFMSGAVFSHNLSRLIF